MGIGKPRPALSRLRVKTPKRTIVPLSVDEVARFWSSFRNSRDLAIVGLMLLQGLRSQEVLDLNRDDLLLSEAQIRVRGKGNKTRFLPLAPEANQLLDHYLRLERPQTSTNALFVSLKGPARGARMTPAGLRSLFRYHRRTTGVKMANPHRFRHTFASDMVRAGVSLPALMQLDGARAHSDHDGLCAGHSSRGLSAVCASRGAAHQARAGNAVMRLSRYAPLEHPLAHQFQRAIESLTAALSPDSARQYRGAARHFLIYLGEDHPAVCSLNQLRRDPAHPRLVCPSALTHPALGAGRLRLSPAVSALHSGGACLDCTTSRSGSSDPSRGPSAHSSTPAPPVDGRAGSITPAGIAPPQ